MLGELLGETRGKRIVRRVLSSDPVKVEVTFEDSGKMPGVEVNGFGRALISPRPAIWWAGRVPGWESLPRVAE